MGQKQIIIECAMKSLESKRKHKMHQTDLQQISDWCHTGTESGTTGNCQSLGGPASPSSWIWNTLRTNCHHLHSSGTNISYQSWHTKSNMMMRTHFLSSSQIGHVDTQQRKPRAWRRWIRGAALIPHQHFRFMIPVQQLMCVLDYSMNL